MEVVAGGSADGISGVAPPMPETIVAHAMLGFEMADHWRDGGAPAHLAFNVGAIRRFSHLKTLVISTWPPLRKLTLIQ